MKKVKYISLILCIVMALQTVFLPALAAEDTALPTETNAAQESLPVPVEELEFGTVCIQNGCRTIDGMVPLGGNSPRLESAQGVFLYEVNTDTVVYSYNPDLKIHPGSLAKIVLALVVLENCDREDVVTVTEGIQSYIPAGANTVDDARTEREKESLKSLEQMTVNDLLHAVLLINANDAAVALAHHVAKTTDAFLQMMNNRVRMIGCSNTEFGNISGLYTAQSHTTARDMARIVREAMKNEDFAEIIGTGEYTIPETNMVGEREFYTQNYMMSERVIPDFYDNRVKGGFQTYHDDTGASLVCVAENAKGLKYVAVILGATRTFAENGWFVIRYGNFNEATDLLEYGFDNFKVNRIIYDGMSLSQFSVIGGECNAVGQAMVNIDSVVPSTAQMDNLIMNFKVIDDGDLVAPVAKDQLIATMSISYRNSVLAEAEVFSMGTVKAADSTGVVIYSTATKSDADSAGFWSVIGTISMIILGLAAAYLAFNAYMRSRIRAQRKRRRQNRRRNY